MNFPPEESSKERGAGRRVLVLASFFVFPNTIVLHLIWEKIAKQASRSIQGQDETTRRPEESRERGEQEQDQDQEVVGSGEGFSIRW